MEYDKLGVIVAIIIVVGLFLKFMQATYFAKKEEHEDKEKEVTTHDQNTEIIILRTQVDMLEKQYNEAERRHQETESRHQENNTMLFSKIDGVLELLRKMQYDSLNTFVKKEDCIRNHG